MGVPLKEERVGWAPRGVDGERSAHSTIWAFVFRGREREGQRGKGDVGMDGLKIERC